MTTTEETTAATPGLTRGTVKQYFDEWCGDPAFRCTPVRYRDALWTANLSGAARRIMDWIELVTIATLRTDRIQASSTRIATETGLDLRTTQRILTELKARYILIVFAHNAYPDNKGDTIGINPRFDDWRQEPDPNWNKARIAGKIEPVVIPEPAPDPEPESVPGPETTYANSGKTAYAKSRKTAYAKTGKTLKDLDHEEIDQNNNNTARGLPEICVTPPESPIYPETVQLRDPKNGALVTVPETVPVNPILAGRRSHPKPAPRPTAVPGEVAVRDPDTKPVAQQAWERCYKTYCHMQSTELFGGAAIALMREWEQPPESGENSYGPAIVEAAVELLFQTKADENNLIGFAPFATPMGWLEKVMTDAKRNNRLPGQRGPEKPSPYRDQQRTERVAALSTSPKARSGNRLQHLIDINATARVEDMTASNEELYAKYGIER